MELETIKEHYQKVIDNLQKEIAEKDKRIAELESDNEALKACWSQENKDACDLDKSLNERIKELESQLPKWHKVSEENPKNYDKHYIGYLGDYGAIHEVPACDCERDNSQQVTHWCEFPQPPKEG